jgi:NitT/TauT family transport system ATP-binding protein
VQRLSALADIIAEPPYEGRADLPRLAEDQGLSTDDLFQLIETLQILGFAHVAGGDIELTPAGWSYAAADAEDKKHILGEHLMSHVGLAAHIRRVLDERPNHRAPASRFLRELEDYLSEEEAERVMDTVINWGRHAELFAYDYDSETLSLDNP